MVKLKYDLSNSDADKAAGGADFEPPKPGVYEAKVREINLTHPKDQKTGKPDASRDMLEVVYEITDKKFKGSRLWDYIVDVNDPEAASAWKYDQFLQAFEVASKKKRKGTFDTDDIIGEACKIRVKAGSYKGNYSADVGAVLAWNPDEDEESDDEEIEDDEDEIEDDDDLEEEDDIDEDEEDEDEEDEEEDDDDGDYLTEDGLSEKSLAELKSIASDDFEIDPLPKGKSKIIAAILEAQGADDEEEGDGEDYTSWSVADLKAELADRELSTSGKKAALVKRLVEDDEEDPF